MPFLDVDRASIFYTDDGPRDAQSVLLVHGMSCDSHDWSWHIPVLSKHYRVIAVDLVGHGRSTIRPDGYDLISLANDLATLLSELGCEKTVVVGHSLGGLIASALAVYHPELVASIVGIDPGIDLPAPDMEKARATEQRILGEEGVSVYTHLFAADGGGEPDWIRTWRMRRQLSTPVHVLAGGFMAMKEDPGMPWMQFCESRLCPVLNMHRNVALAAIDETTFVNPLSRVDIWTECGHFFHQQFPDRINEILTEWIELTTTQLPN